LLSPVKCEMHVKMSRLCSIRKGKWEDDVFFTEILQVQEPKPHVSRKDGQA